MSDIDRLLQVMADLRNPDSGCPWDLQQTLQSLTPYTIEEAYEVEEAAHDNDMAALKGELGDLLFQVVFYARIAEEQGDFDFNDVVNAVSDKLVSRHPHVFSDTGIDSVDEQSELWESLKAQERADAPGTKKGALAGVSKALPALARAEKLQRRAARVGFDWVSIGPVFDKVREELEECRQELGYENPDCLEAEVGDLMFACVNLSRHAGIDAEQALRHACRKFETRFAGMEALAEKQGLSFESLDAESKEALWEAVKEQEK